jgi:hypothetical protein
MTGRDMVGFITAKDAFEMEIIFHDADGIVYDGDVCIDGTCNGTEEVIRIHLVEFEAE